MLFYGAVQDINQAWPWKIHAYGDRVTLQSAFPLEDFGYITFTRENTWNKDLFLISSSKKKNINTNKLQIVLELNSATQRAVTQAPSTMWNRHCHHTCQWNIPDLAYGSFPSQDIHLMGQLKWVRPLENNFFHSISKWQRDFNSRINKVLPLDGEKNENNN